MKYSIKNFRQDFPDDKTCLAFIFRHRYPKGLTCPKCERTSFVPVEGRRSYACACGYQVYPTEGTIFHKSPTPLTLWFHAIFLMSQSKNGVAAKELERQLGVTYKCAWRMAKQIRLLMGHTPGPWKLSSTGQAVSCDDFTIVVSKANAALIAAGPDMLSALEHLSNEICEGEFVKHSPDAIRKLKAAIAKARGKS